MKNIGRSWILGLALFLILLVLIAVSLNFGAASADSVVIWNIRLPRTVAAIGVGVGLGSAGVLLQGSLRNPLADQRTDDRGHCQDDQDCQRQLDRGEKAPD